MARPLRVEFPGAFYHVLNRGNAGEHVLSGDLDKQHFLECLRRAASRFELRIHAYCLMDNHYHLLAETPLANLGKAMQWVNVAYAGWYNRRHQRNGHLFQGRYKALLVDADAYLAELSRYIHRNPVRAGLIATPEAYLWSSCREYLGMRQAPEWLQPDLLLGVFHPRRAIAVERYREFIRVDNAADPHVAATAGFLLGDEQFVESVKRDHLAVRDDGAEVPQLRKLRALSVDQIVEAVADAFGTSAAKILERGGRRVDARVVAIGLAREHSRMGGRELGLYFGWITGAAVTMQAKKFDRLMEADVEMQGRARRIVEGMLNI